jgi:hypothetical protein
MNAIKELDFEEFEKPLTDFLEKYRKEIAENKKGSKGKKAGNQEVEVDDGDGEVDDTEKVCYL